MSGIRRQNPTTSADVFRQFDRMFDEWMRAFPVRMWDQRGPRALEEVIKVDEYRENGDLVIKAEIPGIDPEKDLSLTVENGILVLRAQREVAEVSGVTDDTDDIDDTDDKGYQRHELRYGTFARRLPLPDGVDPSAVTASYKDGMLIVRVPVPVVERGPAPTRIAIEKG